jgi:hypothetical protein
MFRLATFALLLSLFALAPAARAAEPTEAERKLRTTAAEALVKWVEECVTLGARAEALAAIEEARSLDHLASNFHRADQSVQALATDVAISDSDAFAKKRASTGVSLAKTFDRLAALPHDEKVEAARFAGYSSRAMAWDPTDGRRKRLLAAVEKEAESDRAEIAGAMLAACKRADPEGVSKGRYDALELALAQKDRLVLGSDATPLLAWVSLPKGWAKGKKYPVLVAVEGAGCGFKGQFQGFVAARGSRPFIVVTPLSFSNTNALDAGKYPFYDPAVLKEWDGKRIEFDGPGLNGVLEALVARFGAEEKVFLTGFSGGGNLCYWKLLADPTRVAGASPACANFAGYGLDIAPGAGDGGGPPVHLLTGEKDEHREFTFGKKDSPGIEPQTDRIESELKRLGYTNVRRTLVPGAGHSPLRKEVWEFTDEVRGTGR